MTDPVIEATNDEATVESTEVDPCAVIQGATSRNTEAFPLCKCDGNNGWYSKMSVYCGDQLVADRKFNASGILRTLGCEAPYCARHATTTTTSTEPTTTTTVDVRGTCAEVDGAENRVYDAYPLCKCPYKMSVYCEAGEVDDRKFNATTVFSSLNCYAPYCAAEADPTRTTATTTTTAKTTTTETSTTTTTTFDVGKVVDASPFFNNEKKFVANGKTFKCCTNSATNEFVVQDVSPSVRPKARTFCGQGDGCGCMFGDHWHSFGSSCPVTLTHLSSKIGTGAADLYGILSSKLAES